MISGEIRKAHAVRGCERTGRCWLCRRWVLRWRQDGDLQVHRRTGLVREWQDWRWVYVHPRTEAKYQADHWKTYGATVVKAWGAWHMLDIREDERLAPYCACARCRYARSETVHDVDARRRWLEWKRIEGSEEIEVSE